jgi:hypothetical protein
MPTVLVTLVAETGRTEVQGHPRQNVNKIPSQPIRSWTLCHLKHKQYITIQASWGIKARPFLKNNKSKKGWSHGQVIELLPQKHRILNSNLCTAKKKNQIL